jgi:NADPH:quinone reductase-like Zn-dependent oxidoreductase
MKAVHCTGYGPPEVLQLRDVPDPKPRAGEILIRTVAATVTMGDCEVRAFRMAGWIWVLARLAIGITKPRQPILGMEIAGEVVATGAGVSRFSVGDRVFGSSGFGMGAYAEYKAIRETACISAIPDGVSYAQAAGIPTGGLNGLHFVRECRLQPGEKVLVNGAGGSIGQFVVQLAKLAGAEVTAVDRKEKADLLRAFGADHVIAFEDQEFWAGDQSYDAIIDVVGTSPFRPTVRVLNDGGRYVLGNPRLGQMLRAARENRKGRVKVVFKLAGEEVADLDYLKQSVADGTVSVAIDRNWPLAEVAEAHRYVESGGKRGVVIIDVRASGNA